MAHFLRLIGCFLLACCGAVQAAIPPLPQYYGNWGWGDTAVYGSSAGDVCAAMLPGLVEHYPAPLTAHRVVLEGVPTPVQAAICAGYAMHPDGNERRLAGGLVYVGAGTSCPMNSTLSGGACVCTPPFIEGADATAGTCVNPPDDCLKLIGKSAGNKEWWGRSDTYSFCDGWNNTGGGHCVAVASKGLTWEDTTVPQSDPHRFRSSGGSTYTGTSSKSCNGDGATAPGGSTPTDDGKPPSKPKDGEASPAPCPPGQAAGEVNGTRLCAPTGSDVPKSGQDSTTTKNPDGSTTKTDTKTDCTGVNCTVTKTDCTTAAGATSADCKTTTTISDQSGFCDKNKGNKVCQGQGEGTPSSFGGNCDAGFIAKSDDAVLNAMAQEQYKRNCELLRTDKEPSTWLAAEGQKTGDRTGDNPNNGTVAIGPGNFDTSDALGGGGGCNLNKTVTVRGLSVALPFNVLCDPLAVLGQILVAVSLLLAARIVTRG